MATWINFSPKEKAVVAAAINGAGSHKSPLLDPCNKQMEVGVFLTPSHELKPVFLIHRIDGGC